MTIQEKVWKTGMWVEIILAVFLAVLSIKEIKSIEYVGKDVSSISTISVTGKGETYAIPDVATFSFAVTENAVTVTDAQTKATTKVNTALKTVRDAGVTDKDIKTTSYNINPRYDYQAGVCPTVATTDGTSYPCRPGKNVLTGYDVSQSIQVKIRDLNKAGALFSSIGALGAQNVSGLNFSIDDPDSVKAQARSLAIADARSKAKELAEKLGVSLVRITSFFDSSDQPGPIPYAMGMMNSDAAAPKSTLAVPEVPAGQNKVTSNVTITYEIE